MLRPCFYDPELQDFRVDTYSVYPRLILAYLDSPPQPIWQPFTKGQQPVIGNQSLINKRRADELPRIVLDAFDTGNLDLENDYLYVLVASGKGWEIWKVKAKYVLRSDIQVLVPLATVDTTIPIPSFNDYIYGGRPSYFPDLFVNTLTGAPKVTTAVGFVMDAMVLPFKIQIAFVARDEHGVLASISWSSGANFYSDSPNYRDGEILEVFNINGFAVTEAPATHLRAEHTPATTTFTADGFYTRPVALNGKILAPRLRHPSLTKTFTYRNAVARYYKSGTVEVIGWSSEKTFNETCFTGIWQLPSDFESATSSQGLLLPQVGTLIDRFVHPDYAPTLNIFHMHAASIARAGYLVPLMGFFLYGGYSIPSDIPTRLPFWIKIADNIWAFGNHASSTDTYENMFFYIFQPTDNYPCGGGHLLPSWYSLVRDPDLYGPIYLPFYKTPFTPMDIPVVSEKVIIRLVRDFREYEYDLVQVMAEEGVVETPEEGVALRNGALRPVYVTRYLKPARDVYDPHTITSSVVLHETRLGLGGVYITPIYPHRVVFTRQYTPQARVGNFKLTIGVLMKLIQSDIPFVFPEGAYRTIEVSDLAQQELELVGKTMHLKDEMVGRDLAGMRYFMTDVGRGSEILKVLVWQPMWFSHSFTADPNYGDILATFGFKVITIASPPQTEYVTGGIMVGSAWFQNLLRRLRGADLKDADRQLLRDCVCSLDGFWGAIRVTVHYDRQSGLIYMREWRLGVPYGSPVPLTTFSIQPYHEIGAIKDVGAWAFYVDIIDTRTQTIVKRIKVSPTRLGWRVSDVSPSQPIAFTHRKSFVNPLLSVNPSSPYRTDQNPTFLQVVGRSPHALVNPFLTNINDRIYAHGNYPQRFYPLKAPIENLRGVPQQFKDVAQKVYGSQVPVVPVQFGNLNARPIYVAHIPMVVEVRAKRDVLSEIIAKWGIGVALFTAGDRWVRMFPQGLADLGELLHWAVMELWESNP